MTMGCNGPGTLARPPMTRNEYQLLRTQYARIHDLCRRAENTATGDGNKGEVRQLIEALSEQQRAREQIRSFVTHLGTPEDILDRLLDPSSTRPGDDNIADRAIG